MRERARAKQQQHTQSRSSPQLNEGAEPSRVAQTPQPKAHKAMHHQNKKRIIVYQGENNDHIIRLLTQNTKRERERERERLRVPPPGQEKAREREKAQPASKYRHTKPFNTTTKK